MISRRTWLRLTAVCCLLALLGTYAYLSLARLLDRQQIEQLHWQGLSLGLEGIDLERLSLQQRQAAGRVHLQIEQLHLGWAQLRWRAPFWQQIEIARLGLGWPAPASTVVSGAASPGVALEQLLASLALLPAELRITQLDLDLPCAGQRCTLVGDLQLLHQRAKTTAAQQLDLQLNLQHQQHQLNWRAQLQGDSAELQLQLSLAVDQVTQISLRSSLQGSPAGPQWQGQLASTELSQAALLQSWLGQWLPAGSMARQPAPTTAQLRADWQLQLPPGPLRLAQLQQASGQLSASATLPEPWPVPGIGQLQGHFNLAARARAGLWFADSLSADLQLRQIDDSALAPLVQKLRPESLQLRIEGAEQPAELAEALRKRALPLAFSLTGLGPSPFTLSGQLALANAAPWAVQLLAGSLKASSPGLKQGDWQLGGIKLQLALSGYLDPQQLSLKLGKGSQLQLAQLQDGELQLQQLQASSNDLRLSAQHHAGALQNWQLQGPASVSVQRLQHPQLKPQGWQWQGQLTANPQQSTAQGQLHNAAQLQLKLQLQHDSATGLQVQAQLAELFLRSGNPLQNSLSAWPALLSLNNGRLNATAKLSQAPGSSAPQLQLQLSGKGLQGIYDRTALSGLDGALQLQLDSRQMQLQVSELRLQEANPGIPLGPLSLSGRYQASLAQLGQGRLQLGEIHSALMGGQVQIAAGQWDLAAGELLLPLKVQGLELEQLFILYPTEGLAGSGTLDGLLPLRIDAAGVTIHQGQLAARQPGGQLQFHSERIRALGRSNPAMQLVTQSLEDFRYGALTSQVNYDRQGKLQLDIRLQGQNPAIEGGRPIHFNIKLEEDIPSLLASLQLTDKVSEIIQQRVQQRMLQRNAKPVPQEP